MSLSDYGTPRSALRIAAEAHMGQVDLAGMPYLGHVARVACYMKSDAERTVAYLHDVLEDSDVVSLKELQDEFGDEIAMAVHTLTRIDGESYQEYIEQVCDNALAMKVKLADLRDHLGPERHASLRPESYDKYWTAFWRVVQQTLKNAEKENNHEKGGRLTECLNRSGR